MLSRQESLRKINEFLNAHILQGYNREFTFEDQIKRAFCFAFLFSHCFFLNKNNSGVSIESQKSCGNSCLREACVPTLSFSR